jgi:hypothetical protein
MNKENVVYAHNGVLFSHYEKENHPIFWKMDGAGGHHVKQNKLISQVFSYMQNVDFKKDMKV